MMKKEKIEKFSKPLLLILIAVLLFFGVSRILERKTYHGPWNYMGKMNEFYQTQEDSLNYIGLGSSHMYCTVNPLEVWKETGLSGFLLATQQQSLRTSYYYLKEAFKTQSPEIVFLEGFMAGNTEKYPEEEVAYDAIDPLHFSLNKLRLISQIVPPEKWPDYWFNVLKYHSRWKELTAEDFRDAFQEPADTFKGYVCLSGSGEVRPVPAPDYDKIPESALSEENAAALEDIYRMTAEHNAKLVLLIAPYQTDNVETASRIRAEIKWAEEKKIDIIDLMTMTETLGIDPETDFFDETHLDADGAKKVSAYIGEYLKNLGIRPRTNIDKEKWEKDYRVYLDTVTRQKQNKI